MKFLNSPSLRIVFFFLVLALAPRVDVALAQIAAGTDSLRWGTITANFTETSRAEFVKSLQDESLYLQFGYGGEILRVGKHSIGIEGMEWSRLRALPGFRFPVETADYLFGIYDVLRINGALYRARFSHISSHLVDGTSDSVIGGSSSRYSKEFATFEREDVIFGRLLVSYGVRYIFHQVQRIESTVQLTLGAESNLPLRADSSITVYFSIAGGALTTASKDAAAQIGLHNIGTSTVSTLYVGLAYGDARRGVYLPSERLRVEVGFRVSPR